MRDFVHLHVHTQYSILDGASSISGLIKKANADEMKARAITNPGTISGVIIFHNAAKKGGIDICFPTVVVQNCERIKELIFFQSPILI